MKLILPKENSSKIFNPSEEKKPLFELSLQSTKSKLMAWLLKVNPTIAQLALDNYAKKNNNSNLIVKPGDKEFSNVANNLSHKSSNNHLFERANQQLNQLTTNSPSETDNVLASSFLVPLIDAVYNLEEAVKANSVTVEDGINTSGFSEVTRTYNVLSSLLRENKHFSNSDDIKELAARLKNIKLHYKIKEPSGTNDSFLNEIYEVLPEDFVYTEESLLNISNSISQLYENKSSAVAIDKDDTKNTIEKGELNLINRALCQYCSVLFEELSRVKSSKNIYNKSSNDYLKLTSIARVRELTSAVIEGSKNGITGEIVMEQAVNMLKFLCDKLKLPQEEYYIYLTSLIQSYDCIDPLNFESDKPYEIVKIHSELIKDELMTGLNSGNATLVEMSSTYLRHVELNQEDLETALKVLNSEQSRVQKIPRFGLAYALRNLKEINPESDSLKHFEQVKIDLQAKMESLSPEQLQGIIFNFSKNNMLLVDTETMKFPEALKAEYAIANEIYKLAWQDVLPYPDPEVSKVGIEIEGGYPVVREKDTELYSSRKTIATMNDRLLETPNPAIRNMNGGHENLHIVNEYRRDRHKLTIDEEYREDLENLISLYANTKNTSSDKIDKPTTINPIHITLDTLVQDYDSNIRLWEGAVNRNNKLDTWESRGHGSSPYTSVHTITEFMSLYSALASQETIRDEASVPSNFLPNPKQVDQLNYIYSGLLQRYDISNAGRIMSSFVNSQSEVNTLVAGYSDLNATYSQFDSTIDNIAGGLSWFLKYQSTGTLLKSKNSDTLQGLVFKDRVNMVDFKGKLLVEGPLDKWPIEINKIEAGKVLKCRLSEEQEGESSKFKYFDINGTPLWTEYDYIEIKHRCVYGTIGKAQTIMGPDFKSLFGENPSDWPVEFNRTEGYNDMIVVRFQDGRYQMVSEDHIVDDITFYDPIAITERLSNVLINGKRTIADIYYGKIIYQDTPDYDNMSITSTSKRDEQTTQINFGNSFDILIDNNISVYRKTGELLTYYETTDLGFKLASSRNDMVPNMIINAEGWPVELKRELKNSTILEDCTIKRHSKDLIIAEDDTTVAFVSIQYHRDHIFIVPKPCDYTIVGNYLSTIENGEIVIRKFNGTIISKSKEVGTTFIGAQNNEERIISFFKNLAGEIEIYQPIKEIEEYSKLNGNPTEVTQFTLDNKMGLIVLKFGEKHAIFNKSGVLLEENINLDAILGGINQNTFYLIRDNNTTIYDREMGDYKLDKTIGEVLSITKIEGQFNIIKYIDGRENVIGLDRFTMKSNLIFDENTELYPKSIFRYDGRKGMAEFSDGNCYIFNKDGVILTRLPKEAKMSDVSFYAAENRNILYSFNIGTVSYFNYIDVESKTPVFDFNNISNWPQEIDDKDGAIICKYHYGEILIPKPYDSSDLVNTPSFDNIKYISSNLIQYTKGNDMKVLDYDGNIIVPYGILNKDDTIVLESYSSTSNMLITSRNDGIEIKNIIDPDGNLLINTPKNTWPNSFDTFSYFPERYITTYNDSGVERKNLVTLNGPSLIDSDDVKSYPYEIFYSLENDSNSEILASYGNGEMEIYTAKLEPLFDQKLQNIILLDDVKRPYMTFEAKGKSNIYFLSTNGELLFDGPLDTWPTSIKQTKDGFQAYFPTRTEEYNNDCEFKNTIEIN